MAAAEEGARRLLESIEDNKRHNKVVQAWLTKHNDPMYVTDLWFVVKEGEKEIRIPACSAILRVTCGLGRARAVCSTCEAHVPVLLGI